MSAKVIAVVNQKGGVGKTTTAVNMSAVLSIMDKKVLLIDIDAQGNASSGLGIAQTNRKRSAYDIFCGNCDIHKIVMETPWPNLEVIAASNNLSGVEVELLHKKKSNQILKNAIEQLSNQYEYIFIDCPPALNILTVNALACADQVIIPMMCDFFSLEGLSHLLKTIQLVEEKLNPQIKIGGILFTMYDKRNKLTEQVEKEVRTHLSDVVFSTTIPRNIRLAEAPSYGKPAVIYDHKCHGSKAYIELTKEFLTITENLYA